MSKDPPLAPSEGPGPSQLLGVWLLAARTARQCACGVPRHPACGTYSSFRKAARLIFTITLTGKYSQQAHFTGEVTEAQRGRLNSHTGRWLGARIQLREPGPRVLTLDHDDPLTLAHRGSLVHLALGTLRSLNKPAEMELLPLLDQLSCHHRASALKDRLTSGDPKGSGVRFQESAHSGSTLLGLELDSGGVMTWRPKVWATLTGVCWSA